MTLEMKHCGGCGEDKLLSEFNFHKSGKEIGKPLSQCRTCRRLASSSWAKLNPERIYAANLNWKRENPEQVSESNRKSRYKKGGRSASENKSCAAYLGCVVAETVLSHEFPGFVRMPPGNPNYDYKCPKGFTIDVKSACKRKNGNCWFLTIRKNKVPKFFLCLAFGDRNKPLIPEHIWLIPGEVINMQMGVAITDSPDSLAKWAKYERPLTNVLECCDKIRRK